MECIRRRRESRPTDCRSAAASAPPKRVKKGTISRAAVGWNGGLGRLIGWPNLATMARAAHGFAACCPLAGSIVDALRNRDDGSICAADIAAQQPQHTDPRVSAHRCHLHLSHRHGDSELAYREYS